jgi:hypothetical protein
MDSAKISEKIRDEIPKLKRKPSLKLIVLLAFLGYVGLVNAYNLFYVPEEGKPIEIGVTSEDLEPNPYQIRLFERISVIEPNVRINIENPVTESPKYVPPALSKIETTASPTVETKNIEPTQPQSSPTTQPTQTKPKETPSEEIIKPIRPYEVAQVLNKLGLQELKDGSVIELRISESRSEVFNIFIRNGFPDVAEGEALNEDILIWISRQGFFELQKSDDISRTIQALASEGQISLTQKASTWTLWRKGYKSFGEKLGLM